MITHTSDSHQIPSQNKTKSKLQIWKIAKNSMEMEMDPIKTVGATERTRDVGWMDGLTDERSKTNIPQTTSFREQFWWILRKKFDEQLF